jgi:hypothetical protein
VKVSRGKAHERWVKERGVKKRRRQQVHSKIRMAKSEANAKSKTLGRCFCCVRG